MVKYIPEGQDFTFDKSFGFSGSAEGRHDARDHMGEADDDAYGDGSYVERARGGAVRGTPTHERFEGDNANNLPLAKGGRVRRADGGAADDKPTQSNDSNDSYVGGYEQDSRLDPATGKVIEAGPRHPMMVHNIPKDQFAGGGKVRRADGGAMIPTGRPANAPPQPGMGALGRATVTMPVADAARAAQGMVQAGRAIGAAHGAGRAQMPMVASGAATALGAARPPVGQGPVPAMAKGGFIKGAIKHPGRMKHGAEREGVSTHEYMVEHQHSAGSLGAAARLGLRMTGGDLSPRRKKR